MSLSADLSRFSGADAADLEAVFSAVLEAENAERQRGFRLAFDETLRALRSGSLDRQRDLATALDGALSAEGALALLDPSEVARWETLRHLLDEAYTRSGAARAPAALRSHTKYGAGLLDLLASGEGAGARKDLARALGLEGANAPTLSRMLTDFEDAGPIRRERAGRSVTVYLTSAGREHASASAGWSSAVAGLIEELVADEERHIDVGEIEARLEQCGALPGTATHRLSRLLLALVHPEPPEHLASPASKAPEELWEKRGAHKVGWASMDTMH